MTKEQAVSKFVQFACVGGIFLILNVPVANGVDQDSKPAASAPDPVKVHRVEPGELVLKVEREGRIESADRARVRIIPESFGGPFEVIEVVQRSGPIHKGDVIVRLDQKPYDKELNSVRVDLDHARKNLDLSREEQRLQRESNITRLEQTAKARARAAQELMIWEKFDSPDMLKQADLGMMQREFSLADERQELQQLEEMYKGTQLATQTKEIVLDRARRSVKMNEQWLELGKHDDFILRQHRHPDKDKDVRDQARWSVLEDDHAKLSVAAGEQRKVMELEKAEKGLKDTQERYGKLQADGKLFEISAPRDGVMTRIDLEPKDTIGARSVICEVMNPADLVVKFAVAAEDLRVLQSTGGKVTDQQITLFLPEYPEVKITGTIKDLSEIGEKTDGGTNFPMTVVVQGDSDLVRLGLRCKLYASRTLSNVLSIPKTAMKWEDGQATCKVKASGGGGGLGVEDRTITVGPSNEKMIVVLSGLKAGDEVVVEEEKK